MKIKPGFEITNVANDYVLVPVGEQVEHFDGVVVLNEVSAFLLEKLNSDRTLDELALLLTDEFDVDLSTAQADVTAAIEKLKAIGVIND